MKKIINVGKVRLGDGHIVIQSMTNTPTINVAETIKQINSLQKQGAELVRISVPDKKSAFCVKDIVAGTTVPIIADIHFSAEPALIAIENGVSKIRVNPYNMSGNDIKSVVKKCIEYKTPIRVGVNKGSAKTVKTPEQLAESALDCAKIIEDCGWDKIVLAVKTSDVAETILAYRKLAEMTDYPLHIGLTESGTESMGFVKSAISIGSLLVDGIGDTVRVSLPGDPIKEVIAAKKILRAAGIDKNYAEIIACPTCARTCIDVEKIANRVEKATENITKPIKIAIMGCVVNGIGESKGADVGIAGGKTQSAIFVDGTIAETVDNGIAEEVLMKYVTEKLNDK